MKRLLIIPLTSLILFSCKKESFRDFEGKWMSVADYRQQPNGSFEWFNYGTNPGWHFYFTFYPEGKFAAFTDVPGGSGSYSYAERSGSLLLNYEANAYGGTAQTAIYKVERLETDRIVLASYSNSGILYSKTEYARIE